MKNVFNIIVIVLAIIIGFVVWEFIMGAGQNFEKKDKLDAQGKPIYEMVKDQSGNMVQQKAQEPNRKKPISGNVLGMIYTGGPLVAVLMGLILIAITFTIERLLSINKAKGKGDTSIYIKNIMTHLNSENYDKALEECSKQRGSLANIMRASIERYLQVRDDTEIDKEKKMSEVQRAIDEATNLETPLLEKNLVILSTVASISVLVGLLGTTIGMIRAFAAFGEQGSVDATQLAIGISEALYNTAGGLGAAIIAIVSFNFFTTMVDNYVYMIDEAILNVSQLFTVRMKKN